MAGFLVNWVLTARYDIECSADWTAETPGVQTCEAHSAHLGGRPLCCKFPDQRLEYFTFIAFFTGNVVAGYQVVKFFSACLLAFGEKHRHVEGGQTAVQQAHLVDSDSFGVSRRLRSKQSSVDGDGGPSLASQDAVAEQDGEGGAKSMV